MASTCQHPIAAVMLEQLGPHNFSKHASAPCQPSRQRWFILPAIFLTCLDGSAGCCKWDEDDEDGSESTKLWSWRVWRCKTFELQAFQDFWTMYLMSQKKDVRQDRAAQDNNRTTRVNFTVHICQLALECRYNMIQPFCFRLPFGFASGVTPSF